MTPSEISDALVARFGPAVQPVMDAIDPHVIIQVPGDLPDIFAYLRDDDRLAFDVLNCISGVDYLETDAKKVAKAGFEPHTEVIYHLSSFNLRHRFTVKLILPRWKDDIPGSLPEVPTVSHLWKTADWHEREVYDLSGVLFTEHPDLRRILLAEDWEGHPLRKDYEYPLEYHAIRCR